MGIIAKVEPYSGDGVYAINLLPARLEMADKIEQSRCSGADVTAKGDHSARLQAKACAGEDTETSASMCMCSESCPCRSNGCGPLLTANLCVAGSSKRQACCTMPGNCQCSKGCQGKL